MARKSRGGEPIVLPGYMKSLSEDGVRTYGVHAGLVIKNCTATNMRGGFEIRSKGKIEENKGKRIEISPCKASLYSTPRLAAGVGALGR